MADGPAYPPPQPVQPPSPAEPPPPSTVYGPAGAPGAPASTTVGTPATGKRRWWLFVVGLLLLLFSLLPLFVGGILLTAETVVNVADSEADGRLPEADLSFVAEDAQYDIFLSSSSATSSDASDVNCQITLADGEEVEVDGTIQAVGTSIGNNHSVGSFDAVDGRTEVLCTGDSSGERIYIGRDRPTLELAGWVGLGVGIVGLLSGVGLLLLGLFWRKPLPQQAAPIP